MEEYYQTIEQRGTAEYSDRGSRFIAIANPLVRTEDFKAILQEVKKEHPKAVHHCFAYRVGLTGDIFRASDDGEPSGSAGKPILGQIDSKGITNTSIIVVRYFGGTLLGIPGLIKAYKTVSALVLQTIPTVQKQVEIPVMLQFDYAQTSEIKSLLRQTGSSIIDQEIQLFPYIKAGVPLVRLEELLSKIKNLPNVSVKKLVTL